MFATYLKRELLNRKKQTAVVAVGIAIAIALVMTVSAVADGVKASQDQVLGSLYGIGTDITITQTAEPGQRGGRRFDFGADAGTNADGTRTVDTTRLEVPRFAATFEADAVAKVSKTAGVSRVSTALTLNNTTFKGELPEFGFRGGGQGGGQGDGQSDQPDSESDTSTTVPGPTGGSDGAGGSSFDITSFTVMGVEAGVADSGPLSSTKVAVGRLFESTDAGKKNALVDATHAASEEIGLGDEILVNKKSFAVIGIVESNSAESATAANVYIPIDVAQAEAGVDGLVSNIYVTAMSGDVVNSVATALEETLPDATVNTAAELADTVSGSLSTASDLLGTLGRWLSIIVLVVAFSVATLLTVSGVSRRTREFGTLKAIGWRNNRIVRQVAGESVVQGTLGGILGVALGLATVAIVNGAAPVLRASTAGLSNPTFRSGQGLGRLGPGGGGDGGPGLGGRLGQGASRSFDVVLQASTSPKMIVTGVGLAILGGVIAGSIGGWRAARLRPAEAMRSVA